jgi:hypothetical protein
LFVFVYVMFLKSLLVVLFVVLALDHNGAQAMGCAEGYTCYDDGTVVWTMLNEGNTNGPNCEDVCEAALCTAGGIFHQCDDSIPLVRNAEDFGLIAEGLGFECNPGGCWDSEAPGTGMLMVSIKGGEKRKCYFPKEDEEWVCQSNPGNANCFGERYSLVCPCTPRTMTDACPHWQSPPQSSEVAVWPEDMEEGGSCLDRINYWRKRACDEGWHECRNCQLPPMVECLDCHECANSQAQYDSENGAHKSFKRCGERSQGVGGGKTCAAVIDAFVRERRFYEETGEIECRGHCGPILKSGCHTFFWGRQHPDDGNLHVLNWRSCNEEKCSSYCDDPSSNACFSVPKNDNLPPPPPVCSPGELDCDGDGDGDGDGGGDGDSDSDGDDGDGDGDSDSGGGDQDSSSSSTIVASLAVFSFIVSFICI